MLSGIIGAALLGLGATARKGPRTGYPEILEQDLLKVVRDVRRTGASSVQVKDALTGKIRTIPVRVLSPESRAEGLYTWKTKSRVAKGSQLPSSYSVKSDDGRYQKYRSQEVILLKDNLDFNEVISVLKHEIVHASDPSVVLERSRDVRNSIHNYFYSREELKARLAQIEHEIRSDPEFLKMKEYCDSQVEEKLVFDDSSGGFVRRDLIVYRNRWGEKCDPDDVPIDQLVSFSSTARELLTPFEKDIYGQVVKVPIPKPAMKAVGSLLARIQQEVRDIRRERLKKQTRERLRERAKFGRPRYGREDDLGSPPAARFVRKRSYRT